MTDTGNNTFVSLLALMNVIQIGNFYPDAIESTIDQHRIVNSSLHSIIEQLDLNTINA